MRRIVLAGAVAAALAGTVVAAPAALAAPAAPASSAPAGIMMAPAQWIGINWYWYQQDCLFYIWNLQANGYEAMCQFDIGQGVWVAYINV